MGNQVGSCISCQNCVKTQKDLQLEFSPRENSYAHNKSPVRRDYDSFVVVAKPRISYEDQLRKIVKIQSVWRGYQSRIKHPKTKKNHFKEEEVADFPVNSGSTTREKRPKYTFRSGAVYEGEWLGNFRDGYGIQIWTDGARYEGEWRNNKAHGKGKFYHIDGDTYDGQWQDDKANGYGVYVHTNGARYEGQWIKDMQEGYGIEVWPDGSRYDGFYKGGKKHGHGLYKWGDGSKYSGEWQDNRIKGYGVYTWPDGRRYDGEWLDNNMHGKGVHIWPDQRRYEGEYFNDKKDGYGVYLWADGRKYQGYWRDGKQHGIGKYIANNDIKWGIWEEGKRTKWIEPLNDQDVFRFRDGSAVADHFNDLQESLKRLRTDSYNKGVNMISSSKHDKENKNGIPAC